MQTRAILVFYISIKQGRIELFFGLECSKLLFSKKKHEFREERLCRCSSRKWIQEPAGKIYNRKQVPNNNAKRNIVSLSGPGAVMVVVEVVVGVGGVCLGVAVVVGAVGSLAFKGRRRGCVVIASVLLLASLSSSRSAEAVLEAGGGGLGLGTKSG